LLGLCTTLSLFNPFQFRVFAAKSTTFDVTGTDAESSTHLVHLCLLGGSQGMRVRRLEVSDINVA
jgi:hypothetical protein